MHRDEQGQVLPLVAVAILVMGGAAVQLGRLGAIAIERAQARTAADAAALAGAAGDEDDARRLARANGARLGSFHVVDDGADTVVRVTLGPTGATARAHRSEPAGGLLPPGSTTGMAPALRAALARATQLLGTQVPVTSGFRSRQQQAALYSRRGSNPFPVAPPGSSMHERGLAVDVPRSFVARLLAVAPRAGLCHPYPRTDPVHFEVCRR